MEYAVEDSLVFVEGFWGDEYLDLADLLLEGLKAASSAEALIGDPCGTPSLF